MDGHGVDDMSKHAKVIKQIEVAFKAGKYGEAMDLCNLAISINPKDPIAYRAKGRLLQMQRKFEEAIKYYDAAERRGAKDADDFVNRGMCKADLQRYEEAILDFTKALEKKPGYLHAVIQRGAAHWEMRRWDQAEANFRLANQIAPNDANANWILGLLALQRNDFKTGWPMYNKRWESPRFKSRPLHTDKPEWTRESGLRSVLVWSEQGLGDQVIYGSLLPALRNCVDSVTALVDPRLVSIFSRSMPGIQFESHNTKVASDKHDSHLPLASVGAHFIQDLNDIFKYVGEGFLKADPERVEALRAELGLAPDDFVVGLSWVSTAPKIGPHKSIDLKELLPIMRGANRKVVNIQYGYKKSDAELFNAEHGTELITSSVDLWSDIEGVAALLSLCNVFVAISSTTVHLAGALGRRVLLMDSNKLWYWGNKFGDQSAWYPNTTIIQRDNVVSSWANVVDTVQKKLELIENERG
jgi:tetratricopeptide (TPR) repeat protein